MTRDEEKGRATGTGRLQPSQPNMQSIPIRTEEGRKIREAFTMTDAQRHHGARRREREKWEAWISTALAAKKIGPYVAGVMSYITSYASDGGVVIWNGVFWMAAEAGIDPMKIPEIARRAEAAALADHAIKAGA